MSRDLNVDQIKKLWILDLVIRNKSLKKAALAAKVSPSAISQTLTSLEQGLGKTLLVRDRGAVTPTAEALAILEVVRPAFEAFDRLKNLNGLPVPKISWMNFGTYESIAIDILPGLIQSLNEKLPNLRLGLRISRTSNLLTMIRKGELCSALVTEVDGLDRFYAKEVGHDRLGLYVSRRHALAENGSGLEKYALGSLAPGKDGLPKYFTKFLHQYNLPKASVLSDSFEVLRAAATAGATVSVLPHRVASRAGDLREITPAVGGVKSKKEVGFHRMFVVSQLSCDREETDFIAEESRRLFGP